MVFKNEDLVLIGLLIGFVILIGVILLLAHKKKCKSGPTSTYCLGCKTDQGLTHWINKMREVNGATGSPDPNINGYKEFCKNPTNSNWIKAFSKGGKFIEGDPNTNGFNKFCLPCPKCPTGRTCPSCPTGGTCPTCPTGGTCPTYSPCSSPNDFLNAGGNLSDFHNICCSSKSAWNTLTGNKQSDLNSNGYDLYCVPEPGVQRTSTMNCRTCAYSNAEWININGLTNSNPATNGYNSFCMNSSGTAADWAKVMGTVKGASNQNYNRFCGN